MRAFAIAGVERPAVRVHVHVHVHVPRARARPRIRVAALAGLAVAALGACTASDEMIEVSLAEAQVVRTFDVAGDREVIIRSGTGVVVEAWIDGGRIAELPDEQLAIGASPGWLAPQPTRGELAFTILAEGAVTLTVWSRGAPAPVPTRERSVAWFDPALLDDPTAISFARVMAAIADDGHGGALLERWFRAFAAGPGAGRAAFAQFLEEVAAAHGADPRAWDLGALPFRVTGVHNRLDLAHGVHCGELRVSIASTHATFSPVHLIVLFRQPAAADDVTPDGAVHCRGTARRWAQLAALDDRAFRAAARDILTTGITRDRFVMAESVELTISPWQWRQWVPDGAGGLANPPLFQTIDVARVNAPGPTRDAFLAIVRENAAAIAARTWDVPGELRGRVAEVQPNQQAPLVDLSPLAETLATYPDLPRELGLIGCPRCHTDGADFIQTSIERTPSPFYDRELDARTSRLDALAHGGFPPPVPFGPLQPP